jgi:hypothetical protein
VLCWKLFFLKAFQSRKPIRKKSQRDRKKQKDHGNDDCSNDDDDDAGCGGGGGVDALMNSWAPELVS